MTPTMANIHKALGLSNIRFVLDLKNSNHYEVVHVKKYFVNCKLPSRWKLLSTTPISVSLKERELLFV